MIPAVGATVYFVDKETGEFFAGVVVEVLIRRAAGGDTASIITATVGGTDQSFAMSRYDLETVEATAKDSSRTKLLAKHKHVNITVK